MTEKLKTVVYKAIEDYGYRQVVLWSVDDIVQQAGLSTAEAEKLRSAIPALRQLPIPVEPADLPKVRQRFDVLMA